MQLYFENCWFICDRLATSLKDMHIFSTLSIYSERSQLGVD
ncbi:MAG: hypothetical protein V7K54_08065 [Nostoc sp.]